MRLRRLVVPCLALLSIAASPAQATDKRVIADGVQAGGVDLGGLTVDAAAARLDEQLGPHLRRAVVVHFGARAFRLSAPTGKFGFDARLTAIRALHAGEDQPKIRGGRGGAIAGTEVQLAISHSFTAVNAFAGRIARAAYRAPRNASVRITVAHLRVRRARHGQAVDSAATVRLVNAALGDPAASRVLRRPVSRLSPAVSVTSLRRQYGTVVTVDRSSFVLRLFKGLRFVKRYPVAVGMAGLSTPPGHYRIQDKQVDPAWHVPHSAWAGSLQGQTIPGGAPNNPLKARWLGIANGVGIHGTAEDWSIGSAASHGCIRMHVSDVIDLYPRVPVGSLVLIR